ncbi:Vacuolar protein sorting-associated protein 11 [Thelohanellus kitauei]|uniref:Vacuolar protein sorting-associated protein 11 n=1 Tax=Thelohanellus kitauei TaxID=669202 RepID=A0A0C2ITH1_THEKT|nr:Vacuolar protein sorting-associated protein 11 [Thelohanellus kitauei]
MAIRYKRGLNSLARRYSDQSTINMVICKYGDHLYSKGDIDLSMEQYIQTVGTIEPSYIIRKFLEAQSINHLTAYLENLHRTPHANSDHTTLLLNCYIRLKDTGDKEWHFDVETALRVCHQAGFIEQALCLAKKSNNHSWSSGILFRYLKIVLEDVKDYKSAMEYLKNLTILEAESVLKNYGRRLLRDTPRELIALLKNMCTYSDTNPVPSSPEDFIHIFIGQRNYLQSFLEFIVKINPDCSNQIYNTLIELYIYELSNPNSQNKAELETKCLNIINNKQDKYDIDHVLMLCQLNNCITGLVALYEKMGK